jgi:hypothetical protein
VAVRSVWRTIAWWRTAAVAVALATVAAFWPFDARAEQRLVVELNKLESFDGGCRTFFLLRNAGGEAFQSLDMSLAVLDGDGRIDRLLTVDAAPVPADRTSLKLFEIPDVACDGVGELLLYEIGACATGSDDGGDCFDRVELRSRASIPFVK